jgi:hypothetical protein
MRVLNSLNNLRHRIVGEKFATIDCFMFMWIPLMDTDRPMQVKVSLVDMRQGTPFIMSGVRFYASEPTLGALNMSHFVEIGDFPGIHLVVSVEGEGLSRFKSGHMICNWKVTMSEKPSMRDVVAALPVVIPRQLNNLNESVQNMRQLYLNERQKSKKSSDEALRQLMFDTKQTSMRSNTIKESLRLKAESEEHANPHVTKLLIETDNNTGETKTFLNPGHVNKLP